MSKHNFKLASAGHRQEGQALSQQLSQKNVRLLPSQPPSSYKLLKQAPQPASSPDVPEFRNMHGSEHAEPGAPEVVLDSRGQPLPRDLESALLALNALLDQSKMPSSSARAESERSARMMDGSLGKILAYQGNLQHALEDEMRTANEPAQVQHIHQPVNPLLMVHLRNLVHLTFKRKLFCLQLLVAEPREQRSDLVAACAQISLSQVRVFESILYRFCAWPQSADQEDSQRDRAPALDQHEEKAHAEKGRPQALPEYLVEYFAPYVWQIQQICKDAKKRDEAAACLLVFLKLLSGSARLREAAIQRGLVAELLRILPSMLSNAMRTTSAQFHRQVENSAFFICHFADIAADNKAKAATQRHLHHLQLTSSTRHNQIMIEQQQIQSLSYSQPQNKKVTPQQRKSGQHNHLGFNLNLQEVLAGPRMMTGDRYLESGGGLSGGPMSGPSGLGISGKTHGQHHNQQYSNLDTSGIRNHFYKNGPGTGSGGMYGGVTAAAPGTGHVNNSALPPMSTSQSRRLTQMTQQNAASTGPTAGHNKSLDGYRKRVQDSSQSPVRRPQGNNGAHDFDGGDSNTGGNGQGAVGGVTGLIGAGGIVGSQADAPGGQSDGVGLPQPRQNVHRLGHINKQSFVRAASEPPHPAKSLNSKSIILPVQEENENRIDDDGPPSGVQGQESSDEAKKGVRESGRGQDTQNEPDQRHYRDPARYQDEQGRDRRPKQQIMERAKQIPAPADNLRGRKNAENEGNDVPGLASAPPDREKIDSSGFFMSSLAGPGEVQAPAGGGAPNGPQPRLSALAGQATQLSDVDDALRGNQVQPQAPTTDSGVAEDADLAHLGHQAQAQQNQPAMAGPSRRHDSNGQAQNQMHRERTNKLQTASNQVIAAYGDPRDQRFAPAAPLAQPGQKPGNTGPTSGSGSQNKLDLPQNVSLSDDDSSEQQRDSGAESDGASEQIQSENLDTVKDTQKPPSAASRSPLIPKLNLVQIKQDSMLGRHRIETSIGHQNILGTAGAPSLMATPGQHQNLNSVALVQAPAPLTSHYPVITSCSPDKRGGDQILYCMDTSNRTSAIIPIHVGAGGHPRILTSFTNAVGSNPHLISTESVNEFRMDHSGGHIGLPGGGLLSRGGGGGAQGRYWKHAANSGKLNKHAQSFKQQRNNMILKLKQFHTQHTQNNSDMNRGPGFEGEAEQKEHDQEHEQLSDPQLNALISEANATNVSAGGTTTNNNRSNSLKMLDGMASSTLNPFGGTQASNLVGMRDLDGAGGLGAGVGGAGGAILNVGGYNGLGSLYGPYGAYGAGVAGGALLVANPEGQACLQGDAARSMNDLGRQLGESYLAKDLACLLTQQRDMELQNDAEQAVLCQGQRWPETNNMSGPSKLEPAARSKSMVVSQEVLRPNRPSELKTPEVAEKALVGASTPSDAGQTSRGSPEELVRTLALNILVLLLEAYPVSQLRLLNASILLRGLLSFMQSNIFQLPVMQQAVDAVEQRQQLRWLLEQNARPYASNWLTAATKTIEAEQRGMIAVSYQMVASGARNDEAAAFRRRLSVRSEAEAGEVVMLDDTDAVLALLQKFQFANEDIMKRYVHSQFASFIEKQKPGLAVAVEQASRTEAPGQAFDLTSPSASQKKTQPENVIERKLQTLDEDSEEQFRLSRAQALKFQEQLISGLSQHGLGMDDLLADPNLLVSNNGVTYDVTSAQAVPLASKGMCVPREVIRRKLDIVLYVISKQIKNIIVKQAQEALSSANTPPPSAMGPMASSPDLNWLDPSFAQKLTKMIVVLSSYLEGQSRQSSRVLLSQVIDVVLEPLMMVKRLLADVVLRQKIFEHDPTRPIVAFVQHELIQKGLVVDDQLIIQDDKRSQSPPAGGNRNGPADQDPGQHPRQSQQPGDASFLNQRHGLQAEVQMQVQFAANQMVFRHLFAEFLKLIRTILKLPQNCDSLKLLNEAFVGNSTWQSSVENYSKCLCHQDIVSPILVDLHRRHGQQLTVDQRCLIYENLEGLRGINFLNFDEKHFASQTQFIDTQAAIMLGHSIELRATCEAQMQLLSLYLCEALRYHKAMMKFLKTALDIFFPNIQQQQRSNQQMNKAPNGLGGRGAPEKLHCSSFLNRMSHLNNPSRATMHQQNNNVSRGGMINTQTSRNVHQQMDSSFYSGVGGPNNPQQANYHGNSNARNLSPADFPYCQQSQNNKMDTTAAAPPAAQMSSENIFSMKNLSTEQKYWKHAVRRALSQISFWIHEEASSTNNLDANSKALLNQYMDVNSTRYKCIKKSGDGLGGYKCPVSFCVTAAALEFLKHVFDLNEKFTKYMPIDEVLVVYARTHHTSFVRLYNQNKKHLNALLKASKASSTAGRRDPMVEGPESGRRDLLTRTRRQGTGAEGSTEVLKVQLNYSNSLLLSKLHLKCLYALARTRTEDTRRKLHHFQLFSFLAQELNLENEYLAKRKKFLNISQRVAKEAKEADSVEIEEVNSPTPASRRKGAGVGQQPGGSAVGPTNCSLIAAEGPQSFQREQGYILDPSKVYEAQDPNGTINREIQKRIDDSLKMESQKAKVAGAAEAEEIGPVADSSDSDLGLPPVVPAQQPKSLKGFVPSLKIGGLGISTIAREGDGGKTAEQIADMQVLRDQQKASGEKVEEPLSESDSDTGLPPPPTNDQQSSLKMKLAIPNLKINGLGMSTLSKTANGLTAEQLADQELLGNAKPNAGSAAQSSIGRRTSQAKQIMNQPNQLHDIRSETEIESFSNIQESVTSKKASQKSATSTNIKMQQAGSENSGSDSDDGLPPPIPQKRGATLSLPKLQIKGLGISTLANAEDGGRTAEQEADLQILKEQKKVPGQRHQDQQSESAPSETGSSDGLPPPLPAPKPQGFVMPKLAVGGLGLSTLAKNNGKTAEQEADESMLKQQQAPKEGPATSHSRTSRSDSDDGLPPPVPISRPNFALPKLQVGGLGLSTLAKTADGKTAEAMADLELLEQSRAQKMQRDDDSASARSDSSQSQPTDQEVHRAPSSDSDEGLPPPLPPPGGPAKRGIPKLAIGGLGLSTVSNGQNGRTAEQMADQEVLQQQKQAVPGMGRRLGEEESSESDSDLGLPPPLPPSGNANKFLPKLQIGGLGLSTLAKNDTGQTAEQMADMQLLNNSKKQQQSPDPSESSAISRSLEESVAQPQDAAVNREASNSESDSDLGLPPALPPRAPGQVPGFKMPALSLGGLGLSTLKKDGENMTQEEMADASQLQQQRIVPAQVSEDEEDLSSDEQYYRELERIKAEGQANMSQNQSSQMEGGSRSDEDDDREEREGAPQERQRASPGQLQAIDQQEPAKMFSKSNTKVLSAKQTADRDQIGDNSFKPSRLQPQACQENAAAALAQPPAMAPHAKRSGKQKQIKINPIKLNIASRPGGGSAVGDPDGHAKMPMKVMNKAVAPKAATISNQGSGNLTQQLHLKQNPVKLLKLSQRSQAAVYSKSQQSAKRMDDHDASSSRDPNQMPGDLGRGTTKPPMPQGNEGQHQYLNEHPLDGSLDAREPSNPHGIMASDQKPLRPQRPLVDESLMVKATKSTKDPNNQDRNTNNVNLLSQESSNLAADGLNSVLKADDAGPDANSRKQPENFNRHHSGNFSYFKEEPKLPQDWSRSFSIHDQPQAFLPRGQQQRTQTFKSKKKRAIRISKDDFYAVEREKRPLYHDEELHRLMLSLVMCLLLQPQRGTLDDLYCDQYPINNGKQNYLYILHQHIAHEQNQYVIEGLLSEMNRISPPLAGQRLLKLMCPQLFDLKLYNNGKDWKKLAEGAYGTVYECKTNLIQPKSVAIKQMGLPSDIFDRCVLHDIFTEITCLEEFRLERCVTDLYDYGVDSQSYYIVMKKYTCSLGEWRRRQGNSVEVFQKNLRLYVSIYNKVLKSLRTIHSHNVTHYDIKCDNVLISFVGDEDQIDDGAENPGATNSQRKVRDLSNLTDEDFEITFGDFGECRIFSDEKDEFCTRNRGTDCIKSPEMLQLTIHTRKDHDKYDRRKQVGTNRLSDIWSVGCLFYELCTGEFLLYDPDVAYFYVRVVQHQQELITKEKLEKIDNNQYIKDFLKFILIRDQRLRPTIDKVIKRFELIHAIVCNLSETDSPHERGNMQAQHALSSNGGFPQLPASMVIKNNSELQECLHKASSITQTDRLTLNVNETCQTGQLRLIRILESVFMCSADFMNVKGNIGQALFSGITHVVICRSAATQSLRNKFELLEIDTIAEDERLNPFKSMAILMDFIRKVTLYKGRVLFVENQKDNFIKECLLIAFNHIFKTNIFETYTLVKSQSLFFKIEAERLQVISEWNMHAQKIRQYLTTFPQFSCHCGASLIILERSFAQYQNMQRIVSCNCPQKVNKLDKSSYLHMPDVSEMEASPKNGFQTCPCAASPFVSCSEHLEFLDRYYFAGRGSNGTHITQTPLNNQQSQLLWAYLDAQDFVLSPDAQLTQLGHEKSEANSKSLESRRSLASSSQKSRPIPKVPTIPIGQAISHQKGRSGPAGLPSSSGMGYGQQQPPSQAESQVPSTRGQAPRFSKYERHIVSNLSQSLQVNGIPVVTPQKIKAFWAHVKELRLAYIQRLRQMEAQQAAASPDASPSPALPRGLPHGLAGLRNGRGLASGTSLLSNTPEPNSSRQQNLGSRGAQATGDHAVPPGQPNGLEQLDRHAEMMAALQETPKGAKAQFSKAGWDLRKCSICHCWTHAYHAGFNKYAVLLNNRISSHNSGLLSQWTAATGHHGTSAGGSSALSRFGMTTNLEQLERQFLLVREEYLKRLQLLEEQQLQLQNYNGGSTSASRPAPGPLHGPLPLRQTADRAGGSMFSNFQKNTAAMRPSVDRIGMESFTYGINESVLLSSSVGGNRISSNRGRHISSLALGRADEATHGPAGISHTAGSHEGVRVPVLQNLGIQLPF